MDLMEIASYREKIMNSLLDDFLKFELVKAANRRIASLNKTSAIVEFSEVDYD